jgi:hypothetical protein
MVRSANAQEQLHISNGLIFIKRLELKPQRSNEMIRVSATWYAQSEEQASEMISGMVEKYLVGVSYQTKEINDDDDDDEEND